MVFIAKVKVLSLLLKITLNIPKVIYKILLLLIDSLYLAQCIYNNGCDENTIPTIPSYIQPDATLMISEENYATLMIAEVNDANNDICSLITNPFWKSIVIGDGMCNDQTELAIENNNLIRLVVGKSLQSVTSISLSKHL